MVRFAVGTALAALLIVGMMSDGVQAIPPVSTIEWVGGASGEWNDANAWKNTTTGVTGDALTLIGARYGSEGMNNIDPAITAARHIVIGGGARVDFAAETANNDMSPRGLRLRQGSTLTIKDGAAWVHDVSDIPTQPEGSFECRCDPSSLILDGGTFRRTGTFSPEGGGNAIFGSYNDDNNQPRLGTKPPTVNIVIKNGGRLENEGQLWFGTDGESSPNLRTSVTINNGHIDVSGGDAAPIENSDEFIPVEADLVFFYDNSENTHPEGPRGPLNEQHEINFTGPGSITVDSAGIFVYRQDENSIWNTGATQVTYQNLWDMGILKAHGLSGLTGVTVPSGINDNNRMRAAANFSDFFTVSGTPGTDNYKLTSITPALQEVEYVGASGGQWSDADAWRNVATNTTGDAAAIFGQGNGSDGMNTTSLTTSRARNITIGNGKVVNYHGNMIGDLRIRQGSSLTIKDGAVWQQVTDDTFTENAWTQMDMSNLILDNGTYRRSGESPAGDGGGLVLFGSYRDDEAFEEIGGPAKINVEIKNGGRLENTGQLWFGADDEHSPDTRVTFTINDGTIDLTGGAIPITNNTLAVESELAFFYDYSESLSRPKNEEWEINFTGPGSITVDSAGIAVYRQDENSIWAGGDPVSYQDLWEEGILKANGLSGKIGITFGDNNANPITLQPANFDTFFTVTGTPGMDNYKLTSLIEAVAAAGITGDYNDDGSVDAADYVLWRNGGNLQNDPSPGVQPEDYAQWRANFGRTSGAGAGLANAAVPEPSTLTLVALAAIAGWCRRRS